MNRTDHSENGESKDQDDTRETRHPTTVNARLRVVELKRVSPWPFIGFGILTCLGFLYGGSLLFLPWWAVLVLYVIWLPLFVTGCRWFSARPGGLMMLAGAGVAIWLVTVGIAVATA